VEVMPGMRGTLLDSHEGVVDSPEPFADADFSWWSEECGLNVGFSDGIAVDIPAPAASS